MTHRITFTHRAEPHERFASDAFDNNIGKTITFNAPEHTGPARVIAAQVIDQGAAVLLTIEVERVQ